MLEVGRLTHFEWNLRLSSIRNRAQCVFSLMRREMLKKRGEENSLNFSFKLPNREFYLTAVYRRNGETRDQEYLGEDS